MSVLAVARRYAEAIADVALAHQQVEKIEAELGGFAAMMKENRELHDVFASPAISQTDKARLLDALIARTQASEWTANLLRVMLRNYRLHHIETVCEQFRQQINNRRGVVAAEITTAAPASAEDQAILGRKLQELTGKQVQVRFVTDASLIGGAVARVGSVIYDGSIKTQLQAIKNKMKAEDVAV